LYEPAVESNTDILTNEHGGNRYTTLYFCNAENPKQQRRFCLKHIPVTVHSQLLETKQFPAEVTALVSEH
jgi:hypothetical protein